VNATPASGGQQAQRLKKVSKGRSAQNAFKHGFRTKQQIELRKQVNELIRQSREALESQC